MNVKQLEKFLREASVKYYEGTSTLSDDEFDKLRDQLKQEDPDNLFLKEVGAPVASHLEIVPHAMPMGSLSNADDEEAFKKWHEKCEFQRLHMSYKMDGCSVELVYEKGELVQAITRGNSITGEDVTKNVRNFKNIKNTLNKPFTGSVRGEAILYKAEFAKHFPGGTNPRNVGTGTVRRSSGESSEHMRIICFDVVNGIDWQTEEGKSQYIKQLGLEGVLYWMANTQAEAIEIFNTVEKDRDTLDFEIDGIVAKVDRLIDQVTLGIRDSRPKGQVAWKFKASETTSVLESVNWSVGHSGAVIPTATVKPVQIGGVTITHALLNNPEEIERLGIQCGDEVKIIRAGDVVPKIVGVAAIRYKCPDCGFEGTLVDQQEHHG